MLKFNIHMQLKKFTFFCWKFVIIDYQNSEKRNRAWFISRPCDRTLLTHNLWNVKDRVNHTDNKKCITFSHANLLNYFDVNDRSTLSAVRIVHHSNATSSLIADYLYRRWYTYTHKHTHFRHCSGRKEVQNLHIADARSDL